MLTSELRDMFKSLWEKGLSVKEISRILNINPKSVYVYARVYGLKPRRRSSRAKLSEEDIKKIAELRSRGMKIRDIANLMKVSTRTIASYLSALGITLRKYRRCPEIPREDFIRLATSGLRDREIADKLNVSISCVYKYKKLYGVSKRSLERRVREKKFIESMNKIIDLVSKKGYVTSAELRKSGISLNRDLIEKLLSSRNDLRIFKIKYTSTHKFTIFNPRIRGAVLIYKDPREAARYLIAQIIDRDTPLRVINYLMKLNKIPKEVSDEFVKLFYRDKIVIDSIPI